MADIKLTAGRDAADVGAFERHAPAADFPLDDTGREVETVGFAAVKAGAHAGHFFIKGVFLRKIHGDAAGGPRRGYYFGDRAHAERLAQVVDRQAFDGDIRAVFQRNGLHKPVDKECGAAGEDGAAPLPFEGNPAGVLERGAEHDGFRIFAEHTAHYKSLRLPGKFARQRIDARADMERAPGVSAQEGHGRGEHFGIVFAFEIAQSDALGHSGVPLSLSAADAAASQ